MIKLAIVDDEHLIREGIGLLLSSEPGMQVVISTGSGPELLENIKRNVPDLVLMDIQMEPMNGFELAEILRKQYPEIKIVVLSSHYKSSVFGYMIKMGIAAFLPKNSPRAHFITAIKNVHESGVFFSPSDHQLLLSYMNSAPKRKSLFSLAEELSDREIEVIKLLCEQYSTPEISEKLSISPRTVESHRQRILEKTGSKNIAGIVIYAIVNNLYALPV
jgi:DNA-binding NarL/FixJ family response regulator